MLPTRPKLLTLLCSPASPLPPPLHASMVLSFQFLYFSESVK